MMNHLLNEKSPYLLQHAKNPVDWYPWSDEAFEKASEEDKPVFLSIGYSTCHWCHVMAHESFEDKSIAQLLNTRFVPIKVDREERPEIDMVYMLVCQAMTGQGGWPLTIIMTPDKKPFFAGTYLPAKTSYGRIGLQELLDEVAKLWINDRTRLLQLSDEVLAILKKNRTCETEAVKVSWELVERGFEELRSVFDANYGGFGGAPKFPTPHTLLFLLMFYRQTNKKSALDMAEKTLCSMARGGIHDQIGGGFSRYSTDDAWLVPHFEKMLYDNALLVLAYLEGYQITKRAYYQNVAEKILTYVDRELTDPEGGFYCGQDADSEGEEGKYYVFSPNELRKIFETEGDWDKFCHWFGITEKGNFEGKNIPSLIHNFDYENADSVIDELCRKAYAYRLKRMMLHKDDKILTSWNSMMIMAYARAGFLSDNASYLEKAKKAQEFTERYLVDSHGMLLVRYREKESAFAGNLDDYAYYSLALLTLYEVTLDVEYLTMAVHRADQMTEFFWDREHGGFYFYGKHAQELIERPKETYDGAVPSGNSVAAHVLLTLAALTANTKWRELADQQLRFLAASGKDVPSSHTFSLMAFMKALGTEKELVCVSADNRVPGDVYAYKKGPKGRHVSILFKCPSNEKQLSRIAPFTDSYEIPEKGTIYYLCENHTCGVPTSSLM